MINFVLKPELLPISKTTNVHHFYQFQGKQFKQKQLEQAKKMDEMLKKIQDQQQKAKQKKILKTEAENKQRLQNSTQQKSNSFNSYFGNSSHQKNSKQSQPTKSFNAFYQKNKKWKQNVQAQILRRKNQKILQEQKDLQQMRRPLAEKDSHMNISNNTKGSFHAFQSKGPITGWSQRFHDYIKKRLPQEPQRQFKPTINKKSQIIASQMVGKVEDRLIRFGQILKLRKHQMLVQQVQKIGKVPNSQKHYSSTSSQLSNFFYRLYKEGQKTDRKIKQRIQKSQYSFKPAISKLTESMQKKVKDKRQKSPLFTTKKFSKQQTQRLLELYNNTEGKSMNIADFQNFMKRNQLLLQRREKNKLQKQKQDLIKEQRDLQQCTFIPFLNPKNLNIFQKANDKKAVQQQAENEYSDQQYQISDEIKPLQFFSRIDEGPSQELSFNTKLMAKQIKFEYPHSYAQFDRNSLFEYGLNTPVKNQNQEHNSNVFTNQTKSNKRKNNSHLEVSQMDSLQFSNNKNHDKKWQSIEKGLKQKHNHNQDEQINYQLTFSNKKLSNQLSQANQQDQNIKQMAFNKDQNTRQRLFQNNLNKESIKQVNRNMSLKTLQNKYLPKNINQPQELEQQQSQTGQSVWQCQLDMVKNRLQSLMKRKGHEK